MLDAVTPVTDGLPGAPGTVGFGVPPPQDAPLSVQLDGVAAPEPLKPNDADAPGGRLPFHDRLRKVKRCPDRVMSASQNVVMLAPAGRSNATVHDVIVVLPPLRIV